MQIRRFLDDSNPPEAPYAEAPGHFDRQTADEPDEAHDDDELSEKLFSSEDSTETTELFVKVYRDFIYNTPEYQWLLANIRREAELTRGDPDTMGRIRKQILAALPAKQTVTRKRCSQEHRANFSLSWDPLLSLHQQQYSESPDEALERAVTLTGSAEDGQAMTTGEYLRQTWPGSGQCVMELLKDFVRNDNDWVASSKYTSS